MPRKMKTSATRQTPPKKPKFTVKEGRFIRLTPELDQWLCDQYAAEGYHSPNELLIGLVRDARRHHLRMTT